MQAEGKDRLSDEELLSQVKLVAPYSASQVRRYSFMCSTFIIAGAESTSTVSCRALHQLALHPSTQDQLRAEIMNAGENLEYDALAALPMLDAVCKETLRV